MATFPPQSIVTIHDKFYERIKDTISIQADRTVLIDFAEELAADCYEKELIPTHENGIIHCQYPDKKRKLALRLFRKAGTSHEWEIVSARKNFLTQEEKDRLSSRS